MKRLVISVLVLTITLSALLFCAPNVDAATTYNTQQAALYRAVDQLAWYGGMAEFDKLPLNVQNAIRNIKKIGETWNNWPRPYNGWVQQNKILTQYLTTFNDTGLIMNPYFYKLPVRYQRDILINTSIIQLYGQSINMPYWN